jgi:short subunit dehydrogenase-like uncharacterized protein
MPSRIVVFGATGYTGRLTADRLVGHGERPLLAGRSEPRLAELAELLGGQEWRLADVDRPETVAALVGPGDVLLTTVGPFKQWGEPALRAAIACARRRSRLGNGGAVYVDSTGEPPFIRRVFDEFDAPARAAGATLLPAMGYDFVPGTLAGALALEEAGEEVARVDVGYYALGGGPQSLSRGTRASIAGMALDRSFAYRGGRVQTVRSAERVRGFSVRGKQRPAISVGGVEHFTLPAAYPGLREVNVYLGWFGGASRALQASSRVSGLFTRIPGTRAALERLAAMGGDGPAPGTTPGTTSYIVGEAYGADGRQLAEVHLSGADAYDFTARFLAWAARRAAHEGVLTTGAAGPIEAFGLEALEAGCADAGLARVTS